MRNQHSNSKQNKIKAHSLTGRITLELMYKAFRIVKRNRGAAGVDKVSVKMFESNLDENLMALMGKLKKGTYIPSPVRRAYIPKGRKERRPLGIPVVKDRVAQEVVRRILNPVFKPLFHDHSYGFIENRNCHQAVAMALDLHEQGYKIVLDADIKSFFDKIPHKVIVEAVAQRVADGNILRLIERFLKAGVMEDGVFKPTTIGTPQGGVISPLLANIVLNALDWHLEENNYRFVRYADDFLVLCQSKQQAEEALAIVDAFLKQKLQLHLNEEKTTITTYGKGYSFLGFTTSSKSCKMRQKSVEKLKDKVKQITVRCHNLDAELIEKLNRVLRGTANYFVADFSKCQTQFKSIDAWIRMRLRCMKYKRKSRRDNCRMKRKHLSRLGLFSLEEFACARM